MSNFDSDVPAFPVPGLTPKGYAVESSTHKGSVQIYPAAALEYQLPLPLSAKD